MRRLSLFLYGFLAAVRPGLAQDDDSDPVTEVGGRTLEPSDRANATGLFHFLGPDITKPPPPGFSNPASDLEFNVSVRVYDEVVPDPNAGQNSSAFSISDVVLTPASPDVNLTAQTNPNWGVCVNVWEPGPKMRGSEQALDDNGDCVLALPSGCRDNFIPAGFGCASPILNDECEGYMSSSSVGFGMQCSFDLYFSHRVVLTGVNVDWVPKPGHSLFSVMSESFPMNDETAKMEAYAQQLRSVWVVLLTWKRNESDTNGTGSNEVGYSHGPICVGTRNISQGSVDPNGSRLSSPFMGWTTFIVLAIGLTTLL